MTTKQSPNWVSTALPKIISGNGSYVTDVDGKKYLDGSGGPAVFCLGHAHPEVNAAISGQLDKIAYAYRYMFTSDPLEQLQERMTALTDGHFPNSVLVTSGSEAVESCLKLALQYWTAKGQKQKRRFFARRRSWHGNTLGGLSVSDFKERRDPFEGGLLDVTHVSAANAYRPPEDVHTNDLVAYLMTEIETEFLSYGPERIAAFIFEPVVGAAGGVVPAPPDYAQALRALCDKHDILLIADEVMCGAGRCGTWRALAHDGVVPDIMSIAKGLAGGYVPLGAALYGDHIAAAIDDAFGAVLTGHTFSGHTAACAAAVAVQDIITRDGLVERALTKGAELLNDLKTSYSDIAEVGDVRGRGLFIGLELVADHQTKEPFPAEHKLSFAVAQEAISRGLICYPCSGNVDGVRGDTIIISPPYNASEEEFASIRDILGQSIKAVVPTAMRPH